MSHRFLFSTFKLADGTRPPVITQLASAPTSVGDLARGHRRAMPSFMKHSRPRASKIVVSRNKGRIRMRELRPDALASAQNWIEDGKTARAGLVGRLDNQGHIWRALDRKVEAVIQPPAALKMRRTVSTTPPPR